MRDLEFVGSSRNDLRKFPQQVRTAVGYALYLAQSGQKHPHAKPLRGFGSGVLEVVEDYDGNTYRAVYTVRLPTAIYVLHAFQKKSTHGIATPTKEIEMVRARLAQAQRIDTERRAHG